MRQSVAAGINFDEDEVARSDVFASKLKNIDVMGHQDKCPFALRPEIFCDESLERTIALGRFGHLIKKRTECGFNPVGLEPQKGRRVFATTPDTGKHAGRLNSLLSQPVAHHNRLPPPFGVEIALGLAIIQGVIGRIPNAGRARMPHQQHITA